MSLSCYAAMSFKSSQITVKTDRDFLLRYYYRAVLSFDADGHDVSRRDSFEGIFY